MELQTKKRATVRLTKRPLKNVVIDYLYLDLHTCERCVGTDRVLEKVITALRPAFALAGYRVVYRKTEIATAQDAARHRFVSSPTIRVNGRDICNSVQENNCACCGDISGTQVDCRVFVHEGRRYTVPPQSLLAEAILKKAFGAAAQSPPDAEADGYELPPNLQHFFEGKARKQAEHDPRADGEKADGASCEGGGKAADGASCEGGGEAADGAYCADGEEAGRQNR